jgi:hypothetical protein
MDGLTAPIEGAKNQSVRGAEIDIGRTGAARVKRVIYPAGFRWSKDMRPEVGGESCRHAHVGFLARGAIAGEYADGCRFAHGRPPSWRSSRATDAWVEGDEAAVLIEIDVEGKTAEQLGVREHSHS